MTSKLTRERLEKIKSWRETYGAGSNVMLPAEEAEEMASIALAAMDSKPVAWTDEQELRDVDRGGCGYLFTVNPVTPHADERRIILLYRHAQPASEREQVRREHAEWSQATFGNVGPVGPLKHLSKEALEAAEQPGDLSEWADMQFLMWDAQRRAGITDEQITQAMIDKLAVNKQREWPEPKDGEPRLHIKEHPAPVVQKTAHSSVIAEQLANVLSEMKVTDHQRAVISCAVDRLNNVAQLLQLSPSALLVPEILDYQGAKELYNYLMTEEETNATTNGWNACRAAMLAAAPQSPGSEPATVPGKWIPVSVRMPDREVDVQVYCPDKKEQMVAYLERNELEGYFRFATWRTGDGIYCQPTHWMQLPAGPREVKSES